MFIAFLYFEWRTVFKCLQRCRDKCSGRSSNRQIGFIEESNDEPKMLSENSMHDRSDDNLDENINNNLNQLV